jgi:hypothetical protein
MALQVQEQHAALGAAAGAGLPLLMNIGGIDIEESIVDVANMFFEGNAGSASFITGLGFSVIGLIAVGAAWVGPLNGNKGILAMGLGIGFVMLGAQSFDVARRAE